MRTWFTTTAKKGQFREDEDFLTGMASRLSASPIKRYQMAEAPERADIIVYFEPNQYKGQDYARTLLSEKLIQDYPNKCFVVNYDDGPIGFLPGLYVGMPRSKMDCSRFKSGTYMGQYNILCPVIAEKRDSVAPQLLFSFRGSTSAEVRKRIFAANFPDKDIAIQQTFAWFNHTEEEKREYLQEMLNSKFVLCPRGLSTVSIRLFETMELGRVPVILSDEWVEPDGPSWPECSIRVSESKISELPAILRSYEPQAAEMGRQARVAWEQWFSPEMRVVRTMEYFESLILQRDASHDEREYQTKWLSLGFAWENGWTPLQSAGRAIQQGVLLEKVKSKLSKNQKQPYSEIEP